MEASAGWVLPRPPLQGGAGMCLVSAVVSSAEARYLGFGNPVLPMLRERCRWRRHSSSRCVRSKPEPPTGGSVLERSSRSWLQELKHRKRRRSKGGWVVCRKCPCQGVIEVSSNLSFGGHLKWKMVDMSEDNSSLVKDLKSIFPLRGSKVYSSKNILL